MKEYFGIGLIDDGVVEFHLNSNKIRPLFKLCFYANHNDFNSQKLFVKFIYLNYVPLMSM